MNAHPAPRVLIVEDERHLRRLLCDLLGYWSCGADAVADAAEGLALLARRRYDLVLTDLVMPGMSGLEFVQRVRARDGSVPVILFTASMDDLTVDALRLDFSVLRKPLQLAGLETAIRTALARHRSGVARTAPA